MRHVVTSIGPVDEFRYAVSKATHLEQKYYCPPEFETSVPSTVSRRDQLQEFLWPEIERRFAILVQRSLWAPEDYTAYITIRRPVFDAEASHVTAKWSILLWNTQTAREAELTIEYLQLVARQYLSEPVDGAPA
jgi:hypothetical protein